MRIKPTGSWIFVPAVFFAALALRSWNLAAIAPAQDEYEVFGFDYAARLPPVSSGIAFARAVLSAAADKTESDGPPMHYALVILLKRFLLGEKLAAARWFAAILESAGVALAAGLARAVFRPSWPGPLSVAGLGVFSVPSVFYGQFAGSYAIYFFAAVVQVAAYWRLLRRRPSGARYALFAALAAVCALFEYSQVWVTAGLLLASVLDPAPLSRPRRLLLSLAAGALYALLSAMPFSFLIVNRGLGEGMRGYLGPYYPAAVPAGEGIGRLSAWVVYYYQRAYDLLSYHLAFVFDPGRDLALSWNWLLLPFLLIFALALESRLRRPSPSPGATPALFSVLAAFLVANRLDLFPFGGVRNSIIMAPLVWLCYGEAVERISRPGFLPPGPRRAIAAAAVLLPAVPFLLSCPSLYRDRVARANLGTLDRLVGVYRPAALALTWLNHGAYAMLLERYPPFAIPRLRSPALPVLRLSGGSSPALPAGRILAVDFHISADGKREGRSLADSPDRLIALFPPGWELRPLWEETGFVLDRLNPASVYWPSNAFFVYLAEFRDGDPSRVLRDEAGSGLEAGR